MCPRVPTTDPNYQYYSSHSVGNAVPRSRGYMYPGNEIVLNLCISLAMYVSL